MYRPGVHKWMYICLTITVILFSSCLSSIPKVRTESWTRQDMHQWQFESQDLVLDFQVVDRQFLWRFNNKTLVPLQLDHEHLFLEHEGAIYNLWGSLRNHKRKSPPIFIKPGGFVELSYPVRYSSPIFPFPKDGSVSLHFTTRWPRNQTAYILVFPKMEKK